MTISIQSVTVLILLYSAVTLDKASTIVHHSNYNRGGVAHHLLLVQDQDQPLAMADPVTPQHNGE